MDKEYLLTYKVINGSFEYEWYDTEEELIGRANRLGGSVVEMEGLHVNVVKRLVDYTAEQ